MKLVFIYGPPAAGKLTIARKVAEKAGLALYHNHMIVDAVGAVFPFGSGLSGLMRPGSRNWRALTMRAEMRS